MVQQNILVIKLGALGDFIYAAGAMAAIRKHHPYDKITLLTTKPFANMAQQSGYFDDIIIDKRPKFFDIAGWFSLKKILNAAQFSRVYDLQNNDRSRLYFKLFSRKPEWVGTAKGASHRNTSPERSSGHAFYGHQQTLALAGIQNIELDPLLWMDANLEAYPLHKPYVLIVAGCSPTHPEKRWPIEHFRAIIGKLISHGYQPVLIGSKDDAAITAQIAPEFKGFDVLDLTGKTALNEIPALARGATCAIGNDTGPMHMAAMAGCPVVMMFTTQTSKIHKHAPPKTTGVKAFEAYDIGNISIQTIWDGFQTLISNRG